MYIKFFLTYINIYTYAFLRSYYLSACSHKDSCIICNNIYVCMYVCMYDVRSFGELFAILERQLLSALFQAYRAHVDAIKANGMTS